MVWLNCNTVFIKTKFVLIVQIWYTFLVNLEKERQHVSRFKA
jgi:hypothetical protein